jgi:hypothetical protein
MDRLSIPTTKAWGVLSSIAGNWRALSSAFLTRSGPCKRHRAHLGIAHEIIGAADELSLARLLFPSRRVARDDMGHLVGHRGRDLGAVVGEGEQPPGHVKLAIRQHIGIDARRIEDGDAVVDVRPVGCRTQAAEDNGEF